MVGGKLMHHSRILYRAGLIIGLSASAPALASDPASPSYDPRSDAISGSTNAPNLPGAMVAHYKRPEGGDAASSANVPPVLTPDERRAYAAIFTAIDNEEWNAVERLLEEHAGGMLAPVIAAEYFTHANSPAISGARIDAWFARGTELPQAEQLGRLGERRGLTSLPAFPQANTMRWQPGAAKRMLPRTIDDGTLPGAARSAILSAISNDDPRTAYLTLVEIDLQLSPAARAEWRQRVAWSFYIENDDENALMLAERVAEGSGEWVAEGEWVAGLAAWRLDQCARSAGAFARAATNSTNIELTAASHYWAYRAHLRCGEPDGGHEHLIAASRFQDTLYGMLAREHLGIEQGITTADHGLSEQDWQRLSQRENVAIAAALREIGRAALADEVLRHEARIGDPANYPALSRLARELGLPSTQLFMAHNAPYGISSDPALRYPVASWRPRTGWRVDPALAFAHALQESNFRASAVSPANARGLMQIMPGTARDHDRRLQLGASYADLNDPEVNLTYGQQHLEMLRDSHATQGKLPKIMAAYNAGLTPVSRWNHEIRDFDDPLLWMESIPYWETRGYVAIVMRNYWMYERAAGLPSPSRRALSQGEWPRFPSVADARMSMAFSRD